MVPKKGYLQKTAGVSAFLSYTLALACGIFLIFRGEELDYASPVFASVLATFFFLIFVGMVLYAVWRTNLPNLKINLEGINKQDK